MRNNTPPDFTAFFRRRPNAWASIRGSASHPDISGVIRFYQSTYGVIVLAAVKGLPDPPGRCATPVFGFHIHEGTSCTGNTTDPFADTRTHYNPARCPHPYHAGDMPPLFGAEGYAFSAFLTDRFTVSEIIGKTVVLHASPDDFMTQPAGNSGMKIACGQVRG